MAKKRQRRAHRKLTIDEWIAQGATSGHNNARRGKYTYAGLAELCGVSWSTIYRIAKRRTIASVQTAKMIREVSKGEISFEWLRGFDHEDLK